MNKHLLLFSRKRFFRSGIASVTGTSNATFTANAATGPNGKPDGATLVEDSAAGTSHYSFTRVTVTSGLTYYHSEVIKPNGRTWVVLGKGGTGFPGTAAQKRVYFNLAGNGAVGTVGSDVTSYGIQYLGNGFYGVWSVDVANANGDTDFQTLLASADNTAFYNGDGASGVILWGEDISASLPPW